MDPRERQGIQQDLHSGDEELRRLAVERLVVLPEPEAIAALIQCLGDPSWRVRKAAVERLAGWRDPDAAAQALVAALADGDNPGRRNAAVEALIGCGAAAVPRLMEASHDHDVDVRKLAVDAMAGIGDARSTPRMLELLDDPDPNVRGAAADALGACGRGPIAPRLLSVATRVEEDPLVRLSALRALGQLGVGATLADLPGVLDTPLLRPAAFQLLSDSGDEAAVPVLLKALTTSSRTAREAAMDALLRVIARCDAGQMLVLVEGIRETLGSAPDIVADATRRLHEAELPLRLVLVQFLGLLESPECVVPILLAARDEALTDVGLGSLEAMGSLAEAALDAAWDSLEGEARRLACEVLGRTGGEPAPRRLLEALDDPDAETRTTAARGLGRCGAMAALPALVRRLRAVSQPGAWEVEEEVAAIGSALATLACDPDAPDDSRRAEVARLLIARLPEAEAAERAELARILGKIGCPDAADPIELLVSDPSPEVRCAAVAALGRLGPTREALPLALADDSVLVRIAAAGALGGFSAAQVLEDLTCLANDEDARARAAALRCAAQFAGDEHDAPARERLLGLLAAGLQDEGSVAIAAIEGLAGLGTAQAGCVALGALDREDPEILQGSIRCIASHGDPETLDRLFPLVGHPHWLARAEAIQALADRRVTRAIPLILRRLETEQDSYVREVILRALGQLEE